VEAVALIVQIHLQQNRTDLAVKEVAAARRWAQDSLLVNLAESWVGLRVVGDIPCSSKMAWALISPAGR
jgi:coatomer protein complex subunit epsilon